MDDSTTSDADEKWKLSTLEDGSKFMWRRNSADPDDPHIKLLPDDWEDDSIDDPFHEDNIDGLDWTFGTLDDGGKFLWRDTDDPSDPDVCVLSDDWEVGTDEVGAKYLWREKDDLDRKVEIKLVKFLEDDDTSEEELEEEKKQKVLSMIFPD